ALVASRVQRADGARLRVPGFILLFVAAAGIATLVDLPMVLVQSAGVFSKGLLVCALFLVGTELSRQTLAGIRGTVLWQALLLWALVVPLTLVVIVGLG
ncbi:MAG: putative sulfate exporter family transporter, partial [Gammaproteobacteria bacterium]|nr:putative sulfate exporter family transporter [Gammaproteobacteria bacterium]